MKNKALGATGEEFAAGFLRENGYKVLERNFKNKFGEIDIIARDKDTYCFIEVKTRSGTAFGFPQEAVSSRKQEQISKVALQYLKTNKLFDKKARFDVIALLYQDGSPKFDLIKNAFELDGHFTC